jgi:hypothetical protein
MALILEVGGIALILLDSCSFLISENDISNSSQMNEVAQILVR